MTSNLAQYYLNQFKQLGETFHASISGEKASRLFEDRIQIFQFVHKINLYKSPKKLRIFRAFKIMQVRIMSRVGIGRFG